MPTHQVPPSTQEPSPTYPSSPSFPSFRALVLDQPRTPLVVRALTRPAPGPGEMLLRVHCCGVCRTDLHVVDGEVPHRMLPLIPGHEIVGVVEQRGRGAERFAVGERVGVPWLGWTCGECDYCLSGRENLCDRAQFTGYHRPGGYAEYVVADERYCLALPVRYSDAEAAPLLCAGLIGYRSLRAAGESHRIGLYGFGAAAHLVAQIAIAEGREVFAFVRSGDDSASQFARELGAVWAGPSDGPSPVPLDAAIIYAPVGRLVPQALAAVRPGGTVVCAGIHMSDIPSFPYSLVWEERVLRSVANLTRADGDAFMRLASKIPLKVRAESVPLVQANVALNRLREGKVTGALVLRTETTERTRI